MNPTTAVPVMHEFGENFFADWRGITPVACDNTFKLIKSSNQVRCYKDKVYYIRFLPEPVLMCLDQAGTVTVLFSCNVYFPEVHDYQWLFYISYGFAYISCKSAAKMAKISLDTGTVETPLITNDFVWWNGYRVAHQNSGAIQVQDSQTSQTYAPHMLLYANFLEENTSCQGSDYILMPTTPFSYLKSSMTSKFRVIFVRENRLLVLSKCLQVVNNDDDFQTATKCLFNFVLVDYQGTKLVGYKSPLFAANHDLTDCSLNGSKLTIVLSIIMPVLVATFSLNLSI
jgi:hypothetical protein